MTRSDNGTVDAKLLEDVVAIAEHAGERILEIYDTDFGIEEKEDSSPLTKADTAAHRCIKAELGELTPALPVLSEEQAEIAFDERRAWQRYWLVDPLDGTREFIKRNGEFTVNIALIDGHRPVLGVVLAPARGLLYYAARDQGAYRRDDGRSERIAVRRAPERRPTVAGSRSHAGASLARFLENVGEHELVSMGSSLKLCLVAEGRADVYLRLGPTSEWDTAAAQCVVEEAGGAVVDVQGRSLAYNTKASVLNPHFLVVGDTSRDWLRYLEGVDSSSGADP